MQKIIPHLWFDTQAKEAAEFYVSAFGGTSKITSHSILNNTPSGDCDLLSFELNGFKFMTISAGPYFKLNPAISFMINFDPSQDPDARVHLEKLWEKLTEGGSALMPLREYPFSKFYGWVQDRFGVSWQLILTNPKGDPRPFIMPTLLFTQKACGKAEEAIETLVALFKNSKRGETARYPAGMEPDKEGSLMFADFNLDGTWMVAMDSAHGHEFTFNEAISLLVACEDQEEIDHFWKQLSAVPEAEQCGWVKDKFGIFWQIAPKQMNEWMQKLEGTAKAQFTEAFLRMKKFDLKALAHLAGEQVR